MAEILYAPNLEHVVTTNVWAFLHWLRSARGIDLADWSALQRFSVERSTEFRTAVAEFARLGEKPCRLARHSGAREALVFRRADGSRLGLSRDELVRMSLEPPALPAELAAPLARLWPPATLVRPCAELLLHADLRPDDRLLVFGAAWPWLVALLEGSTVILATTAAATCLRSRRRNARPSWSPPRRPSPRRRSSARAAGRTSPACARSSPPAVRSRRRAGAASTPG